MSIWYLLILWPIIGWIRLYLALREERRRSRGKQVMIEDYGTYLYAAIWPFFRM